MVPNKDITIWFLALLAITVYCSVTTASDDLELIPTDIDVCTNQTINYKCVLRNPPEHPITNASIWFEVLKNKSPWRRLTGEEAINESVSELKYKVLPGGDKPYIYIKCCYGNNDSSPQRKSKDGSIAVYNAPEKVKDLNCTVINYVESMHCTWRYGTEYEVMPDVVFRWKDDRDSEWSTPSVLKAEEASCTMNSTPKDGDFTMKHITVEITLTRKQCNLSVTASFHVDTGQIVQPAPVKGLQTTVLNSTCIRLSWRITRAEYKKEQFVNISSKWKTWEESFNTTSFDRSATKKFCDLNPYTDYTFSVRTKPLHGGYFSDAIIGRSRTFAAKPSASPYVTPGGYTLHFNDCGDGKTERNVCLLWKPIKEMSKNDKTANVSFSFEPEVVNVTEWPGSNTYGCVQLSCVTNYTAYIISSNSNGASENASVLNILSVSSGIQQPKFIVEKSNSTHGTTLVYVQILEPPTDHKYGYTIFWCKKYQGHCSKETSRIEWKTSNETEVILKIDGPEGYVYGVSMTSKHGGSGLEWQDCVNTKNIRPSSVPKNVHVAPGAKDKTLDVSWDKLACDSSQPYIKYYFVQYSTGDKPPKNKTVPAIGKSRTVLENLIEDQKYAVTVSAMSKDQLLGPQSTPQHAIPKEYSFSYEWLIGVGCGVFVIMVTIFCIVRCRKFRTEIRERSQIKLPEHFDNNTSNGSAVRNDYDSFEIIQRNNSGDSGYPKSASPPSSESDTEETHCLASLEGNNIINEVSYVPVDESGDLTKLSLCQKPIYDEDIRMLPDIDTAVDTVQEKALGSINSLVEIEGTLPVPFEFRNNDVSCVKMDKNSPSPSLHDTQKGTHNSKNTPPVIKENDGTHSDKPFDKISDQINNSKQLENTTSQTLHTVKSKPTECPAFRRPVNFDYVKAGENDSWTNTTDSRHSNKTKDDSYSERDVDTNNSDKSQTCDFVKDIELNFIANVEQCCTRIHQRLPVPVSFHPNLIDKVKSEGSDTSTCNAASLHKKQTPIPYPISKSNKTEINSWTDTRNIFNEGEAYDQRVSRGEILSINSHCSDAPSCNSDDIAKHHPHLPVPIEIGQTHHENIQLKSVNPCIPHCRTDIQCTNSKNNNVISSENDTGPSHNPEICSLSAEETNILSGYKFV